MAEYWTLAHILSVVAFLSCHGASTFALFRIRSLGTDRTKIADTISFSGTTSKPMYVALIAVMVAGFGSAITGPWGLNDTWIWAALVVLVVTTGLMTAIAKPYFKKVSAACDLRPSGVPRVSDEELRELVRTKASSLIMLIGFGGLTLIVWLMVFKPGKRF
jgi:uncharacterized membrane protein